MKILSVLFFLSFASFAGGTANAATVFNGSMGTAGSVNVQSFNGIQPDDWQDIGLSSSTDLFDATTSFNGFTWAESSDGGTFVHALGPINSIPGEGIIQEITGLTIGVTYAIDFEQSISRSTNPGQSAGGHWEVVFGGETESSDYMVNPALGVAYGWENQSLLFIATAQSQDLSFQAVPAVSGDRLGLGLDGVSISTVTVSPVPVPAAVWLFGSGLALLGWIRRKPAA